MSQITGKVTVFANGRKVKTVGNGSGTTGGYNREPVKGGDDVHGFQEEVVAPTVSFTIAHDQDVSVKEVSNWKNINVMLETDTGVRFIYRQAWTNEPPELNHDTGELPVNMTAIDCDEDS